MHGFREKAHGAVETIAAKPPQHLLRAMREKYDAQRQSRDRRCGIILCGNEFSKHCASSPFSLTLRALPSGLLPISALSRRESEAPRAGAKGGGSGNTCLPTL